MFEDVTMSETEFLAAVKAMGYAGRRQGTSDASWLCDGNTTKETAQAILAQIEGCTLDVPAPFSGEWADAKTADEVIDEETACVAQSLTEDERDELLSAFEDAYYSAYCDTAEELAGFYAT